MITSHVNGLICVYSDFFFLKVSRIFDQLLNTQSLELLKLWADALEKDGNIELAIKKAQEANDKVNFISCSFWCFMAIIF